MRRIFSSELPYYVFFGLIVFVVAIFFAGGVGLVLLNSGHTGSVWESLIMYSLCSLGAIAFMMSQGDAWLSPKQLFWIWALWCAVTIPMSMLGIFLIKTF